MLGRGSKGRNALCDAVEHTKRVATIKGDSLQLSSLRKGNWRSHIVNVYSALLVAPQVDLRGTGMERICVLVASVPRLCIATRLAIRH